MGWAVLIVGGAMFLAGILGQNLGVGKGRVARSDEKKAGVFALRILAILIGAWLVIFGVSHLIHSHGHKTHLTSPQEMGPQ